MSTIKQKTNQQRLNASTSQHLDNSVPQRLYEKWYALIVQGRHEKKIADRLSEKYTVYLPLIEKQRKWSDRTKTITVPLFSGYCFICCDIKQRYFVQGEQGVMGFVAFRGKPAVLPQQDIENMKLMLQQAAEIKVEDRLFSEGDPVMINKGAFAGLKGYVKKVRNSRRLYVNVTALGKSMSVECGAGDVDKKKYN